MQKVAELNLEYGMPTVDVAVQKMRNGLITFKRQGSKAVILIHGYGSTGVGGSIKSAVKRALDESSMKGIVRMHVGGEQWYVSKRQFLEICQALKDFERKIDGNQGVTVVLLRK